MRPLFALLMTVVGLGCAGSAGELPTRQNPTLTRLVLSPDSVGLARAGTQQFSVAGTWSDGSTAAPPVTFSATGGTITPGGLYTAGSTVGSFRVIAAHLGGTLADTSPVTVTAVAPPTLTKLVLSPDTVTLAPAGAQQFSVAGTWSDGSTAPPRVTYSATGGMISPTGLYIAGSTAGSYRVIAVQQSGTLADTSTVTITAGSGGATVLFQESFDDPNLTGRGWYDLPGSITTITTAEHIPGSTASLEIDFSQGGTTPTPAAGGRHLFAETDAVYLRYWVKYSANWVGSGQTYHPHEFQFVTNLDDPYVGPAFTHLTTYVEHNYQNGGLAVLEAQDGANIDQTRVGQDLTGITENRAVAGCNGNADGTPTDCYLNGTVYDNGKAWKSAQPVFLPNPGPGYKGDWHEVEAYFKLNTIQNGVGQLDGIAQYWFDGQLVIDMRHLLLRTGAHPSLKFNQMLMLPYIGDGSPVAQKMWVDDLVVMTGRP
jgi:hypothetical protein